MKLPHRDQREAAMDAAFVEDEVCIVLFSISTILYVHTVKASLVPRLSDVISAGAERTAWAPLFPRPPKTGGAPYNTVYLCDMYVEVQDRQTLIGWSARKRRISRIKQNQSCSGCNMLLVVG